MMLSPYPGVVAAVAAVAAAVAAAAAADDAAAAATVTTVAGTAAANVLFVWPYLHMLVYTLQLVLRYCRPTRLLQLMVRTHRN